MHWNCYVWIIFGSTIIFAAKDTLSFHFAFGNRERYFDHRRHSAAGVCCRPARGHQRIPWVTGSFLSGSSFLKFLDRLQKSPVGIQKSGGGGGFRRWNLFSPRKYRIARVFSRRPRAGVRERFRGEAKSLSSSPVTTERRHIFRKRRILPAWNKQRH